MIWKQNLPNLKGKVNSNTLNHIKQIEMKRLFLFLLVAAIAQISEAQIRQGMYRVFTWQVIVEGEVINDGIFPEDHSTFAISENLMKLSVENFPAYIFTRSKWDKAEENVWSMSVTDYKSHSDLILLCEKLIIDGLDSECWRLTIYFNKNYMETYTLLAAD